VVPLQYLVHVAVGYAHNSTMQYSFLLTGITQMNW
jgi:hypothetical protein